MLARTPPKPAVQAPNPPAGWEAFCGPSPELTPPADARVRSKTAGPPRDTDFSKSLQALTQGKPAVETPANDQATICAPPPNLADPLESQAPQSSIPEQGEPLASDTAAELQAGSEEEPSAAQSKEDGFDAAAEVPEEETAIALPGTAWAAVSTTMPDELVQPAVVPVPSWPGLAQTPLAPLAKIESSTLGNEDSWLSAQGGEPTPALPVSTSQRAAPRPNMAEAVPAETALVGERTAAPPTAPQTDLAAKVQPGSDSNEALPVQDTTSALLEAPAESTAATTEQEPEVEVVDSSAGKGRARAPGMDGAKTTHSMGRTDEIRREPPEALQTLPGQGRALPISAGRPGLDSPAQNSRFSRPFETSPPSRIPAGLAAGHLHAPGGLAGLAALGQPPSTSFNPNKIQTIETLQLRVLNAAQELRGGGAESMSVVIRPDGRTQLQLHLTLQDGQVTVEARMQRGNFQEMNAQWGQLQQSLSLQGIRLNPLENSGPGHEQHSPGWTQSSGSNHGGPQDRPEPGQQEGESRFEFKPPPRPGEVPPRASRRQGARRDSWESWA